MRVQVSNPGIVLRVSDKPEQDKCHHPETMEATTDAGGITVRFYDRGRCEWHALYLSLESAEALASLVVARREERWEEKSDERTRRYLASAPIVRALV